MEKEEKGSLLSCLYLLDGSSCWSKLYSDDQYDRKRMRLVNSGINAASVQVSKILELANRRKDQELLAILNEEITWSSEFKL